MGVSRQLGDETPQLHDTSRKTITPDSSSHEREPSYTTVLDRLCPCYKPGYYLWYKHERDAVLLFIGPRLASSAKVRRVHVYV